MVSFLQQVVLHTKILNWVLESSFKYVSVEIPTWRHEKWKMQVYSQKQKAQWYPSPRLSRSQHHRFWHLKFKCMNNAMNKSMNLASVQLFTARWHVLTIGTDSATALTFPRRKIATYSQTYSFRHISQPSSSHKYPCLHWHSAFCVGVQGLRVIWSKNKI